MEGEERRERESEGDEENGLVVSGGLLDFRSQPSAILVLLHLLLLHLLLLLLLLWP
jgi:hypothetical protein